MNPYSDEKIAGEYLKFLDSDNGKIQREILYSAIASRLGDDPEQRILDAACGNGWLTGMLAKEYKNVEGADSSKQLVGNAAKDHPDLKFSVVDLSLPLPYPGGSFDVVVLNMAILDLDDVSTALKNIHQVLRSEGKIVVTLPNPYYNYPVGVWRPGLNMLLGKKPSLKMQEPYFRGSAESKSPTWGRSATSHIRPLADYINIAFEAGFALNYFEDLISKKDSKKFDLNYQMRRFPLILLLEFKKRGE